MENLCPRGDMIRKVLVANRGEIAIRVMRSCKEMGIRTVAVYSETDRTARHVMYADEAALIGPAASKESYLNIDNLIAAAKRHHADAIHPGYGFLSENADFARRCKQEGLIFIGPSAETMEAMGDKIAARKRMIAAEVPVVPGTEQPLQSAEEALLRLLQYSIDHVRGCAGLLAGLYARTCGNYTPRGKNCLRLCGGHGSQNHVDYPEGLRGSLYRNGK